MKKKIIIILITIFSLILLTVGGLFFYNKWRIDNAKILVELQDNLKVEVYTEAKLSDFIKSINGKLNDDFEINTKTIGKKPIDFTYVNDDKIEVSYSFEIEVVDTKAPYIFSSSSLSVTKGYSGNLAEELFCGDNYDDVPICEITGTYDSSIPGTYPLTFTGTDSSGNKSVTNFNLIVKEKTNSSSSTQTVFYHIFRKNASPICDRKWAFWKSWMILFVFRWKKGNAGRVFMDFLLYLWYHGCG